MRANSVGPKVNLHTYNEGFSSDYYSYQTLEKQKVAQKRHFDKMGRSSNSDPDKENLKHYKRILSLPVGHEYNWKNIVDRLDKLNNSGKPVTLEQIIRVTIIAFPKKDKYLFLFEFGVVVFWSFEEEEEKEVREILQDNCKYAIPSEERHVFYSKRGEVFNISQRNKISIESSDLNEILSVAYALGQHTILAHYENEVAATIEETKRVPIEMRDKGEINMSKKEISRNIGLIFMRRSAVNLNSDILDTPDIFWDQKSEMEVYYSTVRKYLEIDKRVEILDRRMKILKELYDVMNNEIKTHGKFRLEWIVVYLIVIEIFISVFWKMLVKDILKLY